MTTENFFHTKFELRRRTLVDKEYNIYKHAYRIVVSDLGYVLVCKHWQAISWEAWRGPSSTLWRRAIADIGEGES